MTDYRPGYPIDLRSHAMRTRAEQSHLGDFEWAAGRVVARSTGERVVIQDDNSMAGMVDLRIDYSDRAPAYVEVVVDIDPGYSAMADGVRKYQQIPATDLNRAWYLTLGQQANVHRLARTLADKIRAIQRAGELFDSVRATEMDLAAHESPGVRELGEMGVVEMSSRPTQPGESGKLLIYGQGTGGVVGQDWGAFGRWLSAYLRDQQRADVRRKLDVTNAGERHVFIGMSFSTPWGAYHALSHDYTDLPDLPPELPSEITHAWIWSNPLGRCIAWYPERGWFEPGREWATE